jgi:hypothetical protein
MKMRDVLHLNAISNQTFDALNLLDDSGYRET